VFRETDESQEETTREGRKRSGGPGGLGRALALGVAFVAGFVFGRRSRGEGGIDETLQDLDVDDRASEATDALRDVTEDVDETLEKVTGDEEESETTAESGTSEATESVAQSGEAADQPSSMGSVAGEEERQAERAAEDESVDEYEEDVDDDIEPLLEATDVEVDEEVAALSAPTTHGMPMLGLGTYQMDEYDECFESVLTALEMGYRHVDTAEMYENQDAVGDAIAAADVDRDDLFVATKVSPENLAYDHVIASAEESLERLGLDYVDLLYVHWPTDEYDAEDTLDAFAELREEGLIERIGVSNFTVELLEEAIEAAEEPIFANQVEMHPLLPQHKLQQFCAQEDTDVELVAYAPIARGDVSDVDALQDVAEKHDATPEQVSLAWLREKEVTAIPKATSRDHIRDNWLSLDVDLDDEDVETIDDVDREERLVDPDMGPWNE
jgi:2,5-diketo-D-gluconate reductase B